MLNYIAVKNDDCATNPQLCDAVICLCLYVLFVKHWKTAMAAFVTMDTLETEKYALVITNYFVNHKLRRVLYVSGKLLTYPSHKSTFCPK